MKKIDPRYLVMANHIFLLSFGLFYSALQREPIQIYFCFALTLFFEIVLALIFKKNIKRNFFDILKSSVVICLGLLVILISRHWWFYGVAGSTAVLSKYLIRKDSENHIYNPTGFAIISMLTFFPSYLFVRGDQYNGSVIPQIVVILFGLSAIYLSNRWRSTLSYLFTSLILSLIYCGFSEHRFLLLFGPDLGTEGLLFMFLMFTDPKTSPSTFGKQIFQGITIAILNLTFRLNEFAYTQFVALFCFASFSPIAYLLHDKIKYNVVISIEKISSFFQNKKTSQVFIGLILISSILPVITRTLSFPFSDYRMFTDKKSEKNLYAYLPAIKIGDKYRFINSANSYLGLSFILKDVVIQKQYEILDKLLQRFGNTYVQYNPNFKIETIYLVRVDYLANETRVENFPQKQVYEYKYVERSDIKNF